MYCSSTFSTIGYVNNVLCTFRELDLIAKNSLLSKFCYSLYGSVTWDILHPEIDRICVAWRIALRRMVSFLSYNYG